MISQTLVGLQVDDLRDTPTSAVLKSLQTLFFSSAFNETFIHCLFIIILHFF